MHGKYSEKGRRENASDGKGIGKKKTNRSKSEIPEAL